jgi:hypothetical protein
MDIELSAEDFTLLKRVLERYRSDLRMEIADTDKLAWRTEMHADEDRAAAILARLERAETAESRSGDLMIVVRGVVVSAG